MFVVVMVCKVTVNTELVNMEPLLPGKHRLGFCELLGTFSSADQYSTLLYVFLFKDTSLNVYY